MQAMDSPDYLSDRKKVKKKIHQSNNEFRSEKETCYFMDCIDGPKKNKEQLQVADSRCDVIKKDGIEHWYDSNTSWMKWNPEQCRNASKLHIALEPRNPQETQDDISVNITETSDVPYVYSHKMDTSGKAIHDNLGNLLLDEISPRLDIEVSNANTEVGSMLNAPRMVTSCGVALIGESAAVSNEASPGVVTFVFCLEI